MLHVISFDAFVLFSLYLDMRTFVGATTILVAPVEAIECIHWRKLFSIQDNKMIHRDWYLKWSINEPVL